MDKTEFKKACQLLKCDQVIIHPTDTVFGISGLYSSEIAYNKIYSLKNRSFSKPLAVLINDTSQIKKFTDIPLTNLTSIFPYILQGMTILLPRSGNLPQHLLQQSTYIGLRIPNHTEIKSLIDECGPLICTSANLSTETPIQNRKESKEKFPNTFYLNAPFINKNPHSTILKYSNGEYELIREGHISKDQLISDVNLCLKSHSKV